MDKGHKNQGDQEGEYPTADANAGVRLTELDRDKLTPPHWTAGVPYQPVELYFTLEEEAILDEVWEQMEAEWEAERQAIRDRRNARRRELRRQQRAQQEQQR